MMTHRSPVTWKWQTWSGCVISCQLRGHGLCYINDEFILPKTGGKNFLRLSKHTTFHYFVTLNKGQPLANGVLEEKLSL